MAAAPGERAAGWEIDNFEVHGSYNEPFPAIVPHRGKCIGKPSFPNGKPVVSIYLPDDPQGDAAGFVMGPVPEVEARPTLERETLQKASSPNEDELRARMVIEQATFQTAVSSSGFGRIDGGQVVASGCSATTPGSVPFAMVLILAGWGFFARRR